VTTYTYGDIKKRAEKGGFDPNPLGDGKYDCLKVKVANFTEGNGKKPKFGFMVAAEGGPDHGRTAWLNVWLPNPEHPKADVVAAMFLRTMAALGVELHDNVEPSKDAQQAVGNYISATIVTNDAGFQNFNSVKKADPPADAEPAVQRTFDDAFADDGVDESLVDDTPEPDPVLADDEPF
jgi:hypothetical protein